MMMSKLFRPASNLLSKGLPGKRFKELHEYLCLREALNTKESETVLKDLEAASKKLKITPQEATEIVYLLQNDPSYYQGYLKEADLQQLEEIFELEYASSKVKHQGWNFDQYRYSLWQHYPELAQFTKPGPERAAGIKTLEDIFLKDGPSGARAQDADAITNSIPTFKQRIRDHVNSLEGKKATLSPDHDAKKHKTAQVASRIKNILDEMVSLLEINPTLTYGRIRAFIALSKGLPETGRKEFEKKAIGSGETALQWTSPQEEAVAKQITSVEEEEEFDLPYLVEERTVATQKSLSFQLAPWVDDRLRIFEAEVTSPKNLGLWNGLGVVGTVEFLYMLIMQETSLLPMLATGAIGFYGLSIGSRLLRRSAADRLVSVDLHRDGKYVDLIIEGRRGKKTVKDLPIESFKVHTEFKNIEANRGNLKQLAKLIGVKNNITVQDLQKSGLAELGSFATYNENYVFIPVNHEANKAHIGNLFHGKTIAIAGQTPKTA